MLQNKEHKWNRSQRALRGCGCIPTKGGVGEEEPGADMDVEGRAADTRKGGIGKCVAYGGRR